MAAHDPAELHRGVDERQAVLGDVAVEFFGLTRRHSGVPGDLPAHLLDEQLVLHLVPEVRLDPFHRTSVEFLQFLAPSDLLLEVADTMFEFGLHLLGIHHHAVDARLIEQEALEQLLLQFGADQCRGNGLPPLTGLLGGSGQFAVQDDPTGHVGDHAIDELARWCFGDALGSGRG